MNTLSTSTVDTSVANMMKFRELAERYRDDENFRSAIDGGDIAEAIEYLGIEAPEGVTVRLHFNTDKVAHVAIPADPNRMLHDESLAAIAGGKTAGTAACAGTASTMACSTVPGSVSSAGTAGTVGSAS